MVLPMHTCFRKPFAVNYSSFYDFVLNQTSLILTKLVENIITHLQYQIDGGCNETNNLMLQRCSCLLAI
jgi:hypothetical protein